MTVTERALGVLAAFDASHTVLTLTEIGRRAGLPLSTAHRLVGELTQWGALERGADGRYRIGLRLWEVGALAPRSVGLREAAMPFLADLHEVTGENVQLAVLDGTEVVYVDRISGRAAVNVITRVGGRLPLHATGVGLVLLAHAPPELQEQVLAAPLRRYTDRTICSPTELRRVLADVRRTGVAVSDGQIELVALSVAAPVRGPRDDVVAALSVVVPAATSDARSYVPVVRAAARGASRSLAASAP
ncbi:IclR family transcriptional regulator [Pseudonocardia abyssalis]|uniref:IclR family transcriptional regulator n=2 Tax=Pseudonocardia abyssalis TaxID=2792008 RepID=A0ABS6UV76_9PSEU|nr:IclR family transcriptional regulator [Pseudonocardia abyssalis]MBW0136162.1 IclR family transcriptional regulator [Pseudonocardia abyssalis]